MISLLFGLLSSCVGLAGGAAIEPINPESLCERFLKPADQSACVQRAKSMDLDWYAVSICNKIDDDDAFTDCWKKINGRSYSVPQLASCADETMTNSKRLQCLMKSESRGKSERSPASIKKEKPIYQPL